ncbi:hypothetical protein [Spirosoma sp. KUDC1026]|uniref:hypothetical protein n=1 Tax=Spirosoma sp. KUDC1026 TaxID=2745947 RepID=UPI00159B9EDD|nr:hypothetical protein [Spirosoma sp. KUDC1026]QKZ11189.1 hypothetical protein HU175_00450 [Spirosoma sp. KUDC1026]
MKSTTSTDLLSDNSGIGLEAILANWMHELTSLHQHYTHLTEQISKRTNSQCFFEGELGYIDQNPLSNLVALQIRMRTKLEQLLTEMEGSEINPDRNLIKLKAHTLQLRSLNQQAQTRLLLSNLSAS